MPASTHASTHASTLSELLALHVQERVLMQELRHEEHAACVARKMELAAALEAAIESGAALTASDMALLARVKEAAHANAAIAEKMLAMAKGKIDLIQQLGAPSYGSDGRMRQPPASGGLLDLKA